MMRISSVVLTLCALCATAQADSLYHEPYRPQYHFSPREGWIGDPSGLIRYQGKYHAYWWGKAESPDLVHWQQVSPGVMHTGDKNIAFFTGSMAIDRENTSGFGRGAWIAAYTSYENDSKKQAQSISWSRDGREFHWYDNNPVVDLWSSEFRDPTIFWHAETQRWVMVVAKALEKKVKIYSSKDMRQWTWESDFGPAGNSERSWECPDLFPLAVDGDPAHTLWVLLVSINWAQEQYFVGHFDGRRFTLADGHPAAPLYVDKGMDYYASRTFRDYDAPADAPAPATVPSVGWVATWDYAQRVPSRYGKGFWSVPRDLALRTFADGVRLTQTPASALGQLRGARVSVSETLPVGAAPLPRFRPASNTYEMDVRLSTDVATTCGLHLLCGGGRMLRVSYDTRSHYLTIDRTHCAAEPIEGFQRVAFARVEPQQGELRLRVFVDKASVEIFAGEGRDVFTLQTFPAEGQTGIETFALARGVRARIDCWMLRGIWP